jgi:hypothetical protein
VKQSHFVQQVLTDRSAWMEELPLAHMDNLEGVHASVPWIILEPIAKL